MRSLFIILAFAYSFCLISKENPAIAELQKIKNAFSSNATWAKVEVNGFKKETDKTGFLIGKGEFCFLPKKGYFSSFDGEICVSDESRTLFIDKHQKNIGIVRQGINASKKKEAGPSDLASVSLNDSLILDKNVSSGINRITILSKSKDSDIVKTELFFFTDSYKISTIVYHYNKNTEDDYGAEKTEIIYRYQDVSGLSDDFFDTGKIVKKNLKGRFETTEAYRGFTVGMLENK